MTGETAETIALQALAWIAADEELLPVFMGATGAGVDDMKTRATDGDFLVSVLDFLMMDDAWIIRFCEAHGLEYDTPQKARMVFPGGQDVSWT